MNQEHYEIVKKGAAAIKKWRETNPDTQLDLSGADLYDADLYCADLSDADLYDADLRRADLSDADLRSAYLSGANLSGAELRSADLRSADLRSADLSGADLRSANLYGANLSANLYGANLSGAYLSGANLRSANLARSNVTDTCLDPTRPANCDCKGFRKAGNGMLYGYRTRKAGHIDKYRDGWTYSADWFSTDETECHPGLYIWPTLKQAQEWGPSAEIIRVILPAAHVHKAGDKWRTRWFTVVGTAKKRRD